MGRKIAAWLVGPGLWLAFPERAGAEGSNGICDWVHDREALETRVLETLTARGGEEGEIDSHASGPQPPGVLAEDCEEVLRCLLAARRGPAAPEEPGAVEGHPGDAAPAAADAACSEVLSLSPEQVRRIVAETRERLTVNARPAPAASDRALRDESCVEFLECVLRSKRFTGSPQETTWRDDFARICSRTEDAVSLPREEIEELVLEAAALLGRIRKLQLPEAKVYVFRLEKCKAFFEYSLELREARDPGAG